MQKANVYSTLLIKPFEVQKFPYIISSYTTPLLQMRFYKYLPLKNVKWDFQTRLHAFSFDRILMLATTHYFAVHRSKLINSKRELCMKVLSEELGSDPARKFVSIQLSNILHWVPDQQLERHIRFCLRKEKKVNSTSQELRVHTPRQSHLRLRQIARNLEQNYQSWLDFSTPEGSWQSHLIKEDSYNSVLMSSIYLYEYCTNPRQLYEDVKVLQLTLERFNFLEFFAELKESDHRKAVKLCERFLKLIKFRERTTYEYLLHYCKNHNIESLQMRIKLLARVYEGYYEQTNNQPWMS